MHFVLVILASFWVASGASALSCPTIDRSVLPTNERTLKLVQGRIVYIDHFDFLRSSDEAKLNPNKVWNGRAFIEGINLKTKEEFRSEVVVRRSCVSVWCGGSQNLDNALFVLRESNGGFELDLHPCGDKVLHPTEFAK